MPLEQLIPGSPIATLPRKEQGFIATHHHRPWHYPTEAPESNRKSGPGGDWFGQKAHQGVGVTEKTTQSESGSPPEVPPAGIDAAVMRAAVASELFGDFAKPLTVGRYQIEEPLGEGGMGVVYAARDPVLGRRVALKLVAAGVSKDGSRRARMLREAQALAKLSHPNVVHVYEVGEHEGDVYLSMELVDGVSLRDWLKTGRSVEEIDDVFGQAGRGLSAAHGAGLVHRDFKPSNVMVGKDGRVRVLDFGLAHGTGLSTDGSGSISQSSVDGKVTRTGAVLGTPAYMAPEQIRGEPADERADQFAFCVALFEALSKARPYNFHDLRNHPEQATVHDWSGIPRAWRRALRRGLDVTASRRWPSMDALLAALRRGRTWRRRTPWLLLGGSVLAVLAFQGDDAPEAPCAAISNTLEAWNPAREAQIEAAFAATDAPYASNVWATARGRIDAFASHWQETRDDICSASPSPEAIACLGRARTAFDAALEEYERVDRSNVGSIDALIGFLEAPSTCSRPDPVAFGSTITTDHLDEYAQARAASLAARPQAAIEALQPLVDLPELQGTDALSEVLQLLGNAHNQLSETEAAWRDLARSVDVAASGVTRARALVAWMEFLVRIERSQSATDAARLVEAALSEDSPPSLRARLLVARGTLLAETGNVAEGVSLLEEALRISEGNDQPVELARTRMRLANALDMSEDPADQARAEALYREELERRAETLGEQHPHYAIALFNLSRVVARRGEWAEAEKLLRRAEEIEARTLPADSTSRARTRLELADALFNLGRLDEVEPLLDSAWARLQNLPNTHSDHVAARKLLANFTLRRGQNRAALEHHEALREIDPDDVFVHQNIAHLRALTGDAPGAIDALRRARALVAISEFPDVLQTLLRLDGGIAEVRIARIEGREADARRRIDDTEAGLVAMGDIGQPLEAERLRILEEIRLLRK